MRNKRKTIIGLVVSALFLVLIFYNVDFKELVATFKQFEFKNLAVIAGMYAFSLLVRSVRWQFLLQCDKKYSLYRLSSAWVIGNLMNAILPARAGDIWRAYEVGNSVKESKMKLFGSVMLERIFDGVSICVILYFCIMTYANLSWIRQFADLSLVLFGGSLIVFYLVVRFDKTDMICGFFIDLAKKTPEKFADKLTKFVERICCQVKNFVGGFAALKSTYYTFQAVLMSFGAWILEILVTYLVINSFGINCKFSASMFVICFIALGSMIPSSSVFVGPYQYAYILALGIYFIPKSEALAIAFVHQSILMGVLLLLSAVFVLINFLLRIKKPAADAYFKHSQ